MAAVAPPASFMDKQTLSKARVLVTGDAMLDRYWFGDAERISPEAPVPVVRISRTEERLGGAANVAVNIASVGGRSSLLCVVGNDEPGRTLERFAREQGITPHFQFDESLDTTVKLRVVARQQQMLRCDFESHPAEEVLNKHLDKFRALLAEHDALILSDYGKGGLSHIVSMIAMARDAGIPVLIDPKGDDYSRYRGATMLRTPPGRRLLEDRGGAHRQGPGPARRARPQVPPPHPQRGRHDPLL